MYMLNAIVAAVCLAAGVSIALRPDGSPLAAGFNFGLALLNTILALRVER